MEFEAWDDLQQAQLEYGDPENSNDIAHHASKDMSVELSHSSCRSSTGVNQRVRKRQRRLVNAISKSTMGSKGRIIVLPPRAFSIYDSHLLVSLWTNIRRCANRKRIANYEWWADPSNSEMSDESSTKIAFWRQPIACPQFQSSISFWWRRRTEIAFFRQFSKSLSSTAIAKLDHILSLLPLQHLSSRRQGKRPISIKKWVIKREQEDDAKVEKKKTSEKLPYRYCLLDILQGNAGTFWNVSLGSSRERSETRKRELQAIVPYESVPPSSSMEVQQRLEFAILLAWNVTRNQDDGDRRHPNERRLEQDRNGRLDSTDSKKPLLPQKRQAVHTSGLIPPKKRTERMPIRDNKEGDPVRYTVDEDPRLPAVDNVARKSPDSQSPIRKPHPPENATKQSAKVDQARKTELSLLERFGLAPDSEPTRRSPKPAKSKNKGAPESSILQEADEDRPSKRGKELSRLAASKSRQDKAHAATRGKDAVKEHGAYKSSGATVSQPSTLYDKGPEPTFAPRKDGNSFHATSLEESDEYVKPSVPEQIQEQEKASPVATSQAQQASSSHAMSEAEKSEYYRNWQPKNFDLDDDTVWSFNNDNDSDIQAVNTPPNDDDSEIQVVKTVNPKENSASRGTVESPSENPTQYNAPEVSKPHASSRVVTEMKKKRKRDRKEAKKKKKDRRHKSEKRKKKKKSRGELFDKPFPESVLESLEEDEEQPYAPANAQEPPRQASMPQRNSMEFGSPDQPIVIDGGSDLEEDLRSSLPPQPEQTPLLLLCSEDFLESWGDTAARLVSGNWQQNSSRYSMGVASGRRFLFVDTNLVDTCGVDIELPNRGGIIVSALSSWHEEDGFDALMMRIVGLISTTRLRNLSVFLCADVDLDDATVDRIATLQSAVLYQGDGLATATTFTLVSPNVLATSIGQSLSKLDAAWELEEVESWLNDDRTSERLLFLVQLIPTLTATSILQCLMSSPAADESSEDKSRFWFQSIFHQDDRERKRMHSIDPKLLHPAVMKQFSFALGINVSDETVFRSHS